MPDDQKKIVPIDYTATEYEGIRKELNQLAERFYPDTFKDFSEASFGAILLDAVAYVGDQLSFYLDYNVNEAFLDTAYQYNNILRHGRAMGYKHKGRSSTFGKVSLFVLVPATSVGLGPDQRYIPIIKRGTRFSSDSSLSFMLTENVDFANPSNTTVVARTDNATGAPTYYAIKAYGNVVSGHIGQQKISVTDYERFKRIRLTAANVSEIISVTDSEGREYYEVENLSQDVIFKEVPNDNFKNDNVASIVKPFLVSRKFIVEHDRFNTYLQFGSGRSGETDIVAEPQSIAMDVFGKDYISDTSFDPTRLSKNENFGIVPTNTTLTISFRVTNPMSSNSASNSITNVSKATFEFADKEKLSIETLRDVKNSLEVTNEAPIMGDTSALSSGEVKRRILDTFPTQNRAVTKADYENIAYRMPSKYGSLKRVSAQKDPNSLKRNLNLYVISEDNYGKLIATNSTIKNNLKTWLEHYRMISDTIDILDTHILNYGIEFIVRPLSQVDKYDLFNKCVEKLKEYNASALYIGESIKISDIYGALREVPGVMDVVSIKIINKHSGKYSNVRIDINSNMSPDGGYVKIPKNVIAEIKFPDDDIKGKIR